MSSLLGLGVAWFTIPMLVRFGSMPRAIGTSAALCLPMAAFGIAGFVVSPTPAGCPSGCSGYVYLPAVAAIGISAVLAAPMGARLTHVLPVRALRSLYALFLILAAANLTYKSLPVASAAGEARMLIVHLLAPDLAAAPIAAQAPGWLDVTRPRTRTAVLTAVLARKGPRRALFQGAERAPRSISVLPRLSPSPDAGIKAWYRARILKVQRSLKRQRKNTDVTIALPERAIRPAGTLPSHKRRQAERRPKAAPARSIKKRDPCTHQERAKRHSQDCEASPAAPAAPGPAAAQPEPAIFDLFDFLQAPGSGGAPFNWSK